MGRETGVSSASAGPLSPHHLHYMVHCLSIITFLWSSQTFRCYETPKNILDSLNLSHTSSSVCYAIILSNCDSLRNKKLPVLEAQHSSHWWKSTHRTHCDKSGPAVQGSWASEAAFWKSSGRRKYFKKGSKRVERNNQGFIRKGQGRNNRLQVYFLTFHVAFGLGIGSFG